MKETFKIKTTLKESEEERKERIRYSNILRTQIVPNEKKYSRKIKHKYSQN